MNLVIEAFHRIPRWRLCKKPRPQGKAAKIPLAHSCTLGNRPGRAKAVCGPRFGLGGLKLTIARGCIAHKLVKQFVDRAGYLIDGAIKRRFVCLGRPAITAQLAHELKRRRPDLLIRSGRFEIMQGFDAATHGQSSLSSPSAARRLWRYEFARPWHMTAGGIKIAPASLPPTNRAPWPRSSRAQAAWSRSRFPGTDGAGGIRRPASIAKRACCSVHGRCRRVSLRQNMERLLAANTP